MRANLLFPILCHARETSQILGRDPLEPPPQETSTEKCDFANPPAPLPLPCSKILPKASLTPWLVLFWPLGAPVRDSSASIVFTSVGPRFRGSRALFGNPKHHSDTDFHKFLCLLASKPNFQSYDPTTISLTPSEPPRMCQSVQKRKFRLEVVQISPKRPVSSLRVGGMIVSKKHDTFDTHSNCKNSAPVRDWLHFLPPAVFRKLHFWDQF